MHVQVLAGPRRIPFDHNVVPFPQPEAERNRVGISGARHSRRGEQALAESPRELLLLSGSVVVRRQKKTAHRHVAVIETGRSVLQSVKAPEKQSERHESRERQAHFGDHQ